MPQMFLRVHRLERFVFFRPNGSYVEQNLRLAFALLRLVRFKQETRWCANHGTSRLVPMRLSHNASFLRYMRNKRMIKIVGILVGVRQNELRANLSKESCQLNQNAVRNSHRIIAHVEKPDLRTEN